MNNDKTRETHTFKLHDGTENWTSKEARERTIAMVNEYRKRKNNNGGQVSGQQFLQLHSLVFVFTYSFLRGLQLNSVTQKQIQEISTTRMEKG